MSSSNQGSRFGQTNGQNQGNYAAQNNYNVYGSNAQTAPNQNYGGIQTDNSGYGGNNLASYINHLSGGNILFLIKRSICSSKCTKFCS
jgi:hypothetical protein